MVLTCKRTLHGCFASGRYTPVLMFAFSLLLMLSAFWLPASAVPVQLPREFSFLGGTVSRLVAILLFAVSATVLSVQTFFDRRVRWVGALYMWMVAISLFGNGNSVLALVSLLFVLSLALLLYCQLGMNPVRLLFTSFMLLGFMAFVSPYALLLLPLYVSFSFFANIFSPRGLVASLLGLVTPFWLILGAEYVFSGSGELAGYIAGGFASALDVSSVNHSFSALLLLALALLLLLPAIVTFVGSASPAKPLLRRRLSFIMVADAYLLLLCCIMGDGAAIFYFLHLFCQAVLASYLFSGKETKSMNLFFIFVNIIMVAIATEALWLKH